MSQLLGRIYRKSNFISHYLGHVLQKFDKCAQFLVVNSNHSTLEEFITIDVKFHFARLLVRGDVDDGVAVVRLVAGGVHHLPLPTLPPIHHGQAWRLWAPVLAGLGPGLARGGAPHGVRGGGRHGGIAVDHLLLTRSHTGISAGSFTSLSLQPGTTKCMTLENEAEVASVDS